MLSANDKFPSHTLTGVFNSELKEYKLEKGPFVLLYWSSDFKDIKFLTELSKITRKKIFNETALYGVSVDSIETHQKLLEEISFNFAILSDLSHLLALKLGILRDSGYANNAYFFVNKAGIIETAISTKENKNFTKNLINLFDASF